MTRRYRPRVYAHVPGVGCVGCSAPLLLVLGVLLAAYVGLLIGGLAL
jgi:hypothetical protein